MKSSEVRQTGRFNKSHRSSHLTATNRNSDLDVDNKRDMLSDGPDQDGLDQKNDKFNDSMSSNQDKWDHLPPEKSTSKKKWGFFSGLTKSTN